MSLEAEAKAAALRAQVQTSMDAQDWGQAWSALERLLSLRPQEVWAKRCGVVVAMALQRPQWAAAIAQETLEQLPVDAFDLRSELGFNLGQALGLLGQFALAVRAFEQVLAHQPDHVQALLGCGKAYAALGMHAQAGRSATRVLMREPMNLEAISLTANALVVGGEIEKALACFERYESIRPASPFMACMQVFLRRQLADWGAPRLPVNKSESEMLSSAVKQGHAPELALLAHRAWQNMPAIEPFAGLVLYDDPALHHHAAAQWMKHLHPPAWVSSGPPKPRPAGPLRVAYVSSDFYEHATSFLLAGVLQRHNKSRVQVFLLSFSAPQKKGPDAMQQRLQGMGHAWVDVNTWSDAQVAQWCSEQAMDVVVDLKGLTRDSRPGIFAHRAAPVQVNWLGYPGTIPAPFYDWVLADAQVLPPDLEPHFAEQVWRLPHCYQPNDPDRRIDPSVQRRADHGLPESGPVLVCFNNTFKITPEVWAVWMRLLKARPDAVLWLSGGRADAQSRLRAHAVAAGVQAKRLVFASVLPQAQHLARLQLADLSLDTLPYNAHTTASDALWAGVPHVACTGQSFAARVGASVLTAAGMPELVAQGLANYEALALRLLLNDAERQAIRQKLAAQRFVAPLWDATAFAVALEDAFEHMVQRVCLGQFRPASA